MGSKDTSDSAEQLATAAKETGESLYGGVRETLLTGIAIIVPLIVTVYVLTMALDFVANAIAPLIGLFEWLGVIERVKTIEVIILLIDLGIYTHVIDILSEIIVVCILLAIIMVVGSVGRHHYGKRVIDYADQAISTIPGVGTVYKSFRRMGDVMLTEEAENFQDVKLIQCLGDDLYVLGFKTNESSRTIEEAAGYEDMVAVFLPMAPNPVTGGFLTYVPESNVYDLDMTIEEGVRNILTSGIATGEEQTETARLSMSDLPTGTNIEQLQDTIATKNNDRESTSE